MMSKPLRLIVGGCLVALSWSPAESLRRRASEFRQVMTNHGDVQYYGDLTIGGQTLNCVYDTGSFELIVLSQRCATCGDTSVLYNAGQSSSHRKGELRVMHSFGSGTLYSNEAYDVVTDGPFKEKMVPFWEVYNANMPVLLQSHIECIAGLAPFPHHFVQMRFRGKNDDAEASIQDAFGIQSFAFCLGKEPKSDGYLTWNDKTHTSLASFSEIKLTMEDDNPHWTAKLDGVSLGNTKIGCENGCAGIVDSGTSLISLPTLMADNLKQAVSGLDSDCSDLSGLPSFSFTLGGVELSLPPDSYIYQTTDEMGKLSCQALVMTMDMPEDSSQLGEVVILGMPFLRKYFSVFEVHPSRLFVAEADSNCKPIEEDSKSDSALDGRSRNTVIKPRSIDVKHVRWPAWMRRQAHPGDLEGISVRGHTNLNMTEGTLMAVTLSA